MIIKRVLFSCPYRSRERMMNPEIMIVGVCAAGKSTLVQRLREMGYIVETVSQEHSSNPFLWKRREPFFLVVLDCELGTARERRQREIPENRFLVQKNKLKKARENCDFFLRTDSLTVEESAQRILEAYRGKKAKERGND